MQDKEIHILLEDQQKINQFARLNNRLEEFKDDMKSKKTEIEKNMPNPDDELEERLSMDSGLTIPRETWHQGVNKSSKPAHIVEVWRGKSGQLVESDIERKV